MGTRIALFFALAALWPLGVRSAHAAPLFELVGDTGGRGALQARTLADGSAAAYFNPALLNGAREGLSLGFCLLNERIGIALDGRPGPQFGVPEGLSNAGHTGGTRFDLYPVPTNTLQFGRMKDALRAAIPARPRQAAGTGRDTRSYETVGLVVKYFNDKLAIGFHGMIPNSDFMRMRAFYVDEREQYFSNSLHPELYGDRLSALAMALGVGVQLMPRLSVGVGATFSMLASALAPTYVVDTADFSKVLINLDGKVHVAVAPHVGASFELGERLQLSAAVHAPSQLEVGADFTFMLPNGLQQGSSVRYVLDYTPWQVGLGAAFELLHASTHTLALAGSLQYGMWSSYQDRHGERPSPAYAWSDTVSATLGLRHNHRILSSSLDLAYVPSPVPAQTGRSNYVDNDRLGVSLGLQLALNVFGLDITLGAQLQAHALLPRHQGKLPTPTGPDGKNLAPERVKDELPDDAQLSGEPVAAAQGLQTNNPGWPGFSSGGIILAGSAYLSLPL
jgi:hypothetical protein